MRGENTPERKVASTGDRTHNHKVTSPTRSPLSHPGGGIKIMRTIFEKDHSRNIPVKQCLKRVTQGTFLWNYFKIWPAVLEKIFYEFLHVRIVQKAPIHQSHVYRWIKIMRTIFEKDHTRNNPVKLFQNLTSSFRVEDFLRISICPYSAGRPHSPEPFMDRSKFGKQFLKRVTQGTFLWNYFKIWPAVLEKKIF